MMHAPTASPSQHPRVLIADDHEWILNILVRVVEQTLPSAEIIAVEDGVKALAAYQDGGCDFLVSNHFMPNLDGTALVREVRHQAPGLPILMVSVKPEAVVDAKAAGANWFLTKPQIMEHLPTLLLDYAGRKVEPGTWQSF